MPIVKSKMKIGSKNKICLVGLKGVNLKKTKMMKEKKHKNKILTVWLSR